MSNSYRPKRQYNYLWQSSMWTDTITLCRWPMYFVFIQGNIASQEKSSMEQLYIGAHSYSARLVLLLARFSRSQQKRQQWGTKKITVKQQYNFNNNAQLNYSTKATTASAFRGDYRCVILPRVFVFVWEVNTSGVNDCGGTNLNKEMESYDVMNDGTTT